MSGWGIAAMGVGGLLCASSLVWGVKNRSSIFKLTILLALFTLGMGVHWIGLQRAARAHPVLRPYYSFGMNRVRWVVERLRDMGYPQMATRVGCFIGEPEMMFRLRSSAFTPRAPFNPTELTDAQKALSPVLILHGKFGTPPHYARFIEKLAADRPVFFVQLVEDAHTVTAGDVALVVDKVNEIKQLYGESWNHKINIFAYSRGCEVAQASLFEGVSLSDANTLLFEDQIALKDEFGKVVLLGTPFSPEIPNNLFQQNLFEGQLLEIDGEHDLLVRARSRLQPTQQIQVFGSGHVGLIMSDTSLQSAAQFLEETSP